MNQKGSLPLYLGIVIVFFIALAGVLYYFYPSKLPGNCFYVIYPKNNDQQVTRITGNTLNLSSYPKLPKTCPQENLLINITVGFKMKDQSGFDTLLKSLYDPSSPNYKHFLTNQEITDRYGPTQEGYDAVISYMESYGFTTTMKFPNRLIADFQGTRSQAEQTFHISIDDYKQGDRIFYANDTDPGVPSNIAPFILSVNLNNLTIPHHASSAASK